MEVRGVPDDKNFEFDNEYLYDDSLAGTSQYFNQRNQTSGNYLGSYSFENEIGLQDWFYKAKGRCSWVLEKSIKMRLENFSEYVELTISK